MASWEPPALPSSLIDALHRSRAWGFLGDGPIEDHVAHAWGFAQAASLILDPGVDRMTDPTASDPGIGRWMDLGSGGGIPGLVLAHLWPDREAVLLDSSQRRTRFLAEVVEEQSWSSRVRVVNARAELAGRDQDLRGTFSLVVARSFGSPPVTAECAAPFLRRGGRLVVSEPPTLPEEDGPDDPRWPREGLALVGLEPRGRWRHLFGYRILRQADPCPERFPRRVGVAGKRPLYRVDEN
jgi:16S rRNA (guanine527-N7)-methyltransferase